MLQPHLLPRQALLQFQKPEGEDFSDLRQGLQLVGQSLGGICRLQLWSHGPYQGFGRMVSAEHGNARGLAAPGSP